MISYGYQVSISEFCFNQNTEQFDQWNFSLLEETKIDSNTRIWSHLTKFQIGLSIFNIIISFLSFVIFLKINRSQYANKIHIYLLLLSVVEMGNQYFNAYDCTNRYLSINQHELKFSSVNSAKFYVIVNHIHNVMLHSMFSTLNWWIAVISMCRCSIMCRFSLVPQRNVYNIRTKEKIKKPLCILFLIVISSIILNQMVYIISETNRVEICINRDGSASLLSLLNMSNLTSNQLHAISLFTLINSGVQYWFPLMTLFISAIFTWASIFEKSKWHRGRYVKVSIIIGLLITSYLILETPIFAASIYRFVMDFKSKLSENLNDDDRNYIISHYVSLTAEIIHNFGSLINTIIFLVADPTFRKISLRLIHKRIRPICGEQCEGVSSYAYQDSVQLSIFTHGHHNTK